VSYGLTLDQVTATSRPEPARTPWGSVTRCTASPHYSLHQLEIAPGAAQPLAFYPGEHGSLFVEKGSVTLRMLSDDGVESAERVDAGRVIELPPFLVHGLASAAGATVYLFGRGADDGLKSVLVETQASAEQASAQLDVAKLPIGGRETTDRREKYWGLIETIQDGDTAGKRIFLNKGGQSSLEFHVHKHETYFIESGLLKIGLRVGRAENYSLLLRAGESYDIHPGLMHMRMAMEDTVIIEASTRDDDGDSYLVEDGQTYRHVERA